MRFKRYKSSPNKRNQESRPFLSKQHATENHTHQKTDSHKPLSSSLTENIDHIKNELNHSTDLKIRTIASDEINVSYAFVYLEGLVDKDSINAFFNESDILNTEIAKTSQEKMYALFKNKAASIGSSQEAHDWSTMTFSILTGMAAIIIDGIDKGFVVDTRQWEVRGIKPPSSEVTFRGPKESFTETLRTNIAQVRRKIHDPHLTFESIRVGKRTKTAVTLTYLDQLTENELLKEIRARLNKIDIDGIFETGNIEELIEDETATLFPTVFFTERPDMVAYYLLKGKIGILVEGTPFALVIPTTFMQFFQTADDQYSRYTLATLVRFLRITAYFVAILGPSFYIALTTFHHGMIPQKLLIQLAAQRQGVPFPALVEAFLMEVTFEVLREAGIRMPRAVGPAVSIVGALVLGEAAVQAGVVSPFMVIIVSLTAIATFAAPYYSIQTPARIFRFIFMIVAAVFGLYGVMLGLVMMVAHLTALRSFGIPYLSPFAPFDLQMQKDALLRFPLKYRNFINVRKGRHK